MVRCVYCRNFTRKTRHCKYYDMTVKLKDIHKSIPCDGYNSNEKHPTVKLAMNGGDPVSEKYWVQITISKKILDEIAEVKGNYEDLDSYCEEILRRFARKEKREILLLIKKIRGEKYE